MKVLVLGALMQTTGRVVVKGKVARGIVETEKEKEKVVAAGIAVVKVGVLVDFLLESLRRLVFTD